MLGFTLLLWGLLSLLALYMCDSSNTTVITTVISNAPSTVFQDFCFWQMLRHVVRFIGVNVSEESAALTSTSFTLERTQQVSPTSKYMCLSITLWRSWLRNCAASRKAAGSIPDGVTGIFHCHNPSGRTIALGLTQLLTEMSHSFSSLS